MDEIQQLSLLLKQVQDTYQCNNLPERYCVDLIKMAIDRNLLNVIHTLDGREYITPDRIEKEINDYIVDNGGRISLTDLQKIINIDYSYISKYTKELVEKNNKWVILNNDILTNVYLDRIVQETQDFLDNKGIISYSEISKKFSIPIDFMLETFSNRMDQLFNGIKTDFSNGSFVSNYYNLRQRAKVHGHFLGSTAPVKLAISAKTLGISENFLSSILNSLLIGEELIGTIYRAVYFPNNILCDLKNKLHVYFEETGYLPHAKIPKSIFNDALPFIKDILKDCCFSVHYLSKIAISDHFIVNIAREIEEIRKNEDIFLIDKLLNDDFEHDDKVSLIELVLKKLNVDTDSEAAELIFLKKRSVVFSSSLITVFADKMIQIAENNTKSLLMENSDFKQKIFKFKQELKNDGISINSNHKRAKYSRNSNTPHKFISEYFPLSQFKSALSGDILEEAADELFSLSYRIFEKSITVRIFEVLNQYCTGPLEINVNSPSKKVLHKQTVGDLLKNVAIRFNLMLLYEKCFITFDSEITGKFSTHAIKFMGIPIADNLLRIYLIPLVRDFQMSDDEYKALISDDVMSKNERMFFLKQIFKKSHQDVFTKLYQSNKSWNDFSNTIMTAKESFMPEIPFKLSLTKANEKASKELHLNFILGVLDVYLSVVSPTLDECSTAFQNCLSLSFTHKTGYCVIFPPRLINVVVDKVTPLLEPDLLTLIQALHAKISTLYLDKQSDSPQLPNMVKANLDLLVKLTIETAKTLQQ